jgi:hypothetical protein
MKKESERFMKVNKKEEKVKDLKLYTIQIKNSYRKDKLWIRNL